MSKTHSQLVSKQQLDERAQQVEALMVLLTEKDDEISHLRQKLQGAIAAAKEELKSEAEQKLRQKLAVKLHRELHEKLLPEVQAEIREELRSNILSHISEEQLMKYIEKPLEERRKVLESEIEARIAEQVEQRVHKEVATQLAKEKAVFRNKINETMKPKIKDKDKGKSEEQRLRLQITSMESKHLCEVQSLNREISNFKKRISGYETTIELLRSQTASLAAELSDTQKALKMAAESLADQYDREESRKIQLLTQQETHVELAPGTLDKSVIQQIAPGVEGEEDTLCTVHNAHSSPGVAGAVVKSQDLAPAVDLNTNTVVFMPDIAKNLSSSLQPSPVASEPVKKVDEIWTSDSIERTKQSVAEKLRSSHSGSSECERERAEDIKARRLRSEPEAKAMTEVGLDTSVGVAAAALPMVSNMPVHVSGDIGFSTIGAISTNSSVDLEASPSTSTGPIVELSRSVTTTSMFGRSSLVGYLESTPVVQGTLIIPGTDKDKNRDNNDTLSYTGRACTDISIQKAMSIPEMQAAMVRHFSDELREQTKFMESSPLQIPDGQLGNLIESAIQFLFKIWDYIEEAFALRNSCLNGIRTCLEQGSLDSALKLAQVELLRCRKVKEEFGDIFELVRERELKKANEEDITDITGTLLAVLDDCGTTLLYRGFPYNDIIKAESS